MYTVQCAYRFQSRRHRKKKCLFMSTYVCSVVYLFVNPSMFCTVTSRQKLSFIAAEFMIFLVRLHKAGHCSCSLHEICLWVGIFIFFKESPLKCDYCWSRSNICFHSRDKTARALLTWIPEQLNAAVGGISMHSKCVCLYCYGTNTYAKLNKRRASTLPNLRYWIYICWYFLMCNF